MTSIEMFQILFRENQGIRWTRKVPLKLPNVLWIHEKLGYEVGLFKNRYLSMKISYIGKNDGLAQTLIRRMKKEGHEVYLLSDKIFPENPKVPKQYHFYQIPKSNEKFESLLHSIAPDWVVFAGNDYLSEELNQEADDDVTLLAQTLRSLAPFPQVKFLLLSSTSVYGRTEEVCKKANEAANPIAVNERGLRFIRQEKLVELYCQNKGLNASILRASSLYTNQPKENEKDFLSQLYTQVFQKETVLTNRILQPLDVSDLVDAINRVIEEKAPSLYNVCGEFQVDTRHLYELICQQEKIVPVDVQWQESDCNILADDCLIREKMGWSNFHNLEDQLQKREIHCRKSDIKAETQKKKYFPVWARQLLENITIFALFFILNMICQPYDLFSQINWMMIYVILISVTYNIYQSGLAAILASFVYLSSQGTGLLELYRFQSYAGSILAVVQYLFVGLVVSYTVNLLKEEKYNSQQNLNMLEEEYDDLKAVNEENVLIKNEYEERLLTTKSGFPKLYSLVSRLLVQEPDRILMETMQIISELIHTDTVAVYQGQSSNPWLRLVAALSDDSAMDGKSWNLSNTPQILEAITKGELYQGKFGSDEPAIVLPIVTREASQAVVLIKSIPYESETHYHINLLKTLSLLLQDAMEKALQYEKLSRTERCVEDTDVLKPQAFYQRVLLAQEKADKGMAEYCVIELEYPGSLIDTAGIIGHLLRMTDCLGVDENGKLFALLNNTGPDNLPNLLDRLERKGIHARLIKDAALSLSTGIASDLTEKHRLMSDEAAVMLA